MFSYIFVGGSCFYSGLLVGAHTAIQPADCTNEEINPERKMMESKIDQQANRITTLLTQLKNAQKNQPPPEAHGADDTASRFPGSVYSFMGGMATVDRTAFAERFDVGVPLQDSSSGNEDVLLLYAHADAVPASDPFKAEEAKSNTQLPNYGKDVEMATENCDTVNLMLLQPNERTQCYALMGQFRGFHIHKFMRLPEEGGRLDRSAPLKLVNRGAQASGRLSVKVPRRFHTEQYWKTLTTYLQNLDPILEELKPYAEKAAVNNTIVVLVSNHGQSELLLNFACSSRARGFDISKVLVFATDEETRDLAHGLGLNVFYDEKVRGLEWKG